MTKAETLSEGFWNVRFKQEQWHVAYANHCARRWTSADFQNKETAVARTFDFPDAEANKGLGNLRDNMCNLALPM